MPKSALEVATESDPTAWDAAVNSAGGHPLQLWAWGDVKAMGGNWTANRLRITTDSGELVGLAQVLTRKLPVPFRGLSYIPRGPVIVEEEADYGVGDDETRGQIVNAITQWCNANLHGIAVSLEPDWPVGTALPDVNTHTAQNHILWPLTLIIDLGQEPDALLAEARKSTRYEIRKAERDGLEIVRVTDDETFRKVMDVFRATAERAGFPLHDDDYYLAVHHKFGDASRLMAALDANGEPCNFAWAVVSDRTAFLLYGGSNDAGRELHATAPVYWASMMDARDLGVTRYDMNGLLNDGISTFKRSFAKHENELVGSIDIPLKPTSYSAWEYGLPHIKTMIHAYHDKASQHPFTGGIPIVKPATTSGG